MNEQVTEHEKLESCVRRILSDPDFPACSDNIRSLVSLSAQEDSSFRSLTDIILKDVGLTLRILKSANSAYYNRTNRPIVSIAHAVVLLGMETVSMIASGIRFIETFAQKNPGLRELVTFSLLTASQARQIAIEASYHNPEEAYLCGLLRNLGEVLTAHYFPREYAEIIVRMDGNNNSDKPACRAVLGFTYETLAAEVLQQWRIGGEVRACLLTDPATLPSRPVREIDLLRMIANFSHFASTAVHRSEPDEAPVTLRRLVRNYGPGLSIDNATLKAILDTAVSDTRDSFLSLGITIDCLKLRSQAKGAVALLGEVEGEEAERDAERALQFFEKIEETLRTGEGFDLTAVVMMALEALANGRAFQRAIFALVNSSRSMIEGKLGFGPGSKEAVEAFRFSLSVRGGPVAMALLRKEDLLVDLSKEDPRPAEDLMNRLKPGVFAIYPIVVHALAIGCLYIDRPDRGARIPEWDLKSARKLRDLLVLAVDRMRSHSGSHSHV